MTVRDIVMAAAGVGGAPPAPSTDPQFNYVTMLLHGDGTNGAQNNTFVDSSTNNFTITRNGTPTQGSFSPYGDLWSNYFPGSGSFIQASGSQNQNLLGNGDFTIEAWVFSSTSTFNQTIVTTTSLATGARGFGWNLRFEGGYNIRFYVGSGTAGSDNEFLLATSTGITINTWNHIAVVRNGATVYVYVNGVQKGSAAMPATYNLTGTVPCQIGQRGTSLTEPIIGNISNCRIVNGTALYTSAFTPPTTPLTAVSGTSLLTCQSNRFRDNSSNNFAITVTGTPSVQRFSPFDPAAEYSTSVIGGSGIFTATSQFLTAPASSTAWSWGTSSYTIELWVYPTDLAVNRALIAKQQSTSNDWELYLTSAGGVNFRYWNGSQQLVSTAGSLVATNRWTHIAFVNNAGAITIYVNGVSSATGTVQSGWSNGNLTLKIGQAQFGTSPSDYLGYMSNVRLVNGTAVYTAAFTPPTAPLTAITNTSLLLNTVNAGIFDNAMMNDLVTVGNAQVSTAVKKYGTGSMAFDGSGDNLSVIGGDIYNLPGDFTVECWVYISGTGVQRIAAKWNGAGNIAWLLQIDPASYVEFGYGNSGSFVGSLKVFTAIGSNTWKHIAVTRSGTTVRMFVDGTQIGAGSNSSNLTAPNTVAVTIGQAESGFYLNGYIDDLRITKGVARYTANFTPPTAAFPNN